MNSGCTSVKSKNDLYTKCKRKTCDNSDFCSIHLKQKKKILFDSNRLSPLDSCNDTDIVSLERIYYLENNKRVLAREIKQNFLFTYKIEVNGQIFQRTLNILSMKSLIDCKLLKDPFSNVPFPEEVINEAKEKIKNLKIKEKKLTKTEQKSILITNLLRKFEEVGYIIHPEWIINMKKNDQFKWYNEVVYLWKDFRIDHVDVAINMFPSLDLPHISNTKEFELKILKLFND